jgi:putative ABC transport system permease protein
MIVSGISSAQAIGFLLGVSLVLLSTVPIARALGAPDRLAHTAAGLAIVVFWLIPLDRFDFIANFSMGFEIFLVGGLLIVVGATWTLMYNAQLVLGAVSWGLGRVRTVAPMLKLSMAYPLRSLFRTGVTLAMFTLVVFTLVTGVTISGSFNRAFDNLETFGGGFDVRAVAAPASPLVDLNTALREARSIERSEIAVAASQSIVPLHARQADTSRAFESYPVTGVDDAFLSHTTYPLAAIADGYGSAPDVWRAIAGRPGLAVVDPFVAPRRDHFVGSVLPDFQLSGFHVEDGRFRPTPVDVRDEQTGTTIRLTVIGVLADTAPELMVGITTSQRTLRSALGARAQPTVYWLDLRDGADPAATATALESAFLANGVEAEALEETLDDTVAAGKTFNFIIEGFMGLGLVVGVAALGVITARAVVERRQQIGVLRSIGFQKRMIQAAFLAESSFIALTAIVVGSALGLVLSYNVISDQRKLSSWESLAFTVPWLSLAVIFLVVYAVAMLTTLAPAVRASRVYPAEALRYQ